jgi:hypothetical protein
LSGNSLSPYNPHSFAVSHVVNFTTTEISNC